jgi:lipoate-protein ligase B
MAEGTIATRSEARVLDLGLVDYERARTIQLQLVDKRIEEKTEDTFLFVSHPPTITIGRGGGSGNVIASPEVLESRKVKIYEVERGGDVTFHGPGQQVVYPIVNLDNRGRDLHQFLRNLEEVVIQFLLNYDISGVRVDGKTGVWVQDKKICAIGIAVKRWVSYHGLALNLDTDLTYFQLINPCGFHPDSVTSLQSLTDGPIDRSKIFFQLVNAIENVFGVEVVL